MYNDEGGRDPETFRMAGLIDRVDAIGTGILGLTLQCAQCHDHKYDPISQEEYYKLLAFLNNDDETEPLVYSPAERETIARLRREMSEVEAGLRASTPDWAARLAAWEDGLAAAGQPHWTVLPLTDAGTPAEHWYSMREEGSVFTEPSAPGDVTATFTWTTTTAQPVTAFRLELLTDPNLPCGGPGRSLDGTCALSEFEVETAPAAEPKRRTRVKLSAATADVNPAETPLDARFGGGGRVTGPASFAIDGKPGTAWGIDVGPGRRNRDRKAVFVCAEPIVPAAAEFPRPGGTIVTFRLRQGHGGANLDGLSNNNLGRFRISATSAAGVITADPLPARVRALLGVSARRRTPAQVAEIFSYWRTTVPQWKDANERIEALWRQWPAGARTLALAARATPRQTWLLVRGEIEHPGGIVTAGVPAFLHPLPADTGEEPSRLTLARWLVDRKSPTTARAFVNRLWQAYFGRGIVETSEDLGRQSTPPSHPELLDWLAVEFMDHGWSIKHLQRLIVTSATYRQSSDLTPDRLARDPYNRLLARGPRFRVDADVVRDIALAASGLLNDKIGGPSVMPPAPAFLFQPPASFAPFPWVEETGPEKYRRALYTFQRRSTPYPMLQAFDAPDGFASCTRRSRSNTPLQALTTLNEPVFVDCARGLARVAIERGGAGERERLTYACRRAVSRMPSDGELAGLLTLLRSSRQRFERGELNAEKVIGAAALAGIPPSEQAAYVVVARVLLNLDEAITKN
jgi:hypothetical protein